MFLNCQSQDLTFKESYSAWFAATATEVKHELA